MGRADSITFRSGFDVDLIDSMGSDERIVQAARVSTAKDLHIPADDALTGLINYLMRERHGSPFEHVTFTWRISAPIFVAREFMRHRMASYNEESGRYTQLAPVFYMPPPDRKLVQTGKVGHYTFQKGSGHQHKVLEQSIKISSIDAYKEYEALLQDGIAREVARMVLPVNIYTSWYVTMNARGLMNFLSLRMEGEHSHPQWEIAQVAESMGEDFAHVAPITAAAWDANGRVAP